MTNKQIAVVVAPFAIVVVLLAVIAVGLFSTQPAPPVSVGSQAVSYPSTYASRTYNVTTTAINITTFGFTTTLVQTATRAYITPITGTLYVMWDGSTPGGVLTNSHVISPGTRLDVYGYGNISNLQMVSGDTVTVTISLER